MRRLVSLLGMVFFACAALGAGAQAACTLTFEAATSAQGNVAQVTCEGRTVMTLLGASADTRAQALAQRLDDLAESGLKASEVRVVKAPHRARLLTVRGARLVTIDRATARAYGMSPSTLASRWLANLQTAFKRPYLSVAPVVVPLGETRASRVRGNISGAIRLRTDSSVATGHWNDTTKTIQITGQEVGRATLTVMDDKTSIQLPVRVAKYAAQLDSPITAVVTGSPASRFALESAVAAAVQSAIHPEPEATCEILTDTQQVEPLYPGRPTRVPVSVSATGPEYLAYRARPAVVVTNQPYTLAPVSLLMVSNSPEKLPSEGLWYEGTLSEQQTARLLYHHVNASGAQGLLTVEIWNLGQQAARLHLTAGLGGPSNDELWVGHRAMSEFLRNFSRNAGWIISVPPGTVMTVLSQSMPARSIVSGVAEIRPLEAANVSVRLALRPAATAIGLRPIEYYQPSPLLGAWQYPSPLRQIKAKYEVGGNWTFVTIGDQPAVGLKEGDRLLGSYGVMYEVQLELSNPTNAPAPTGILMEPAGGAARGSLLVDGRPVETSVMRNSDEAPVASYTLAPGETRTVRLLTMPQAGSNYPVRLVARPL